MKIPRFALLAGGIAMDWTHRQFNEGDRGT